MVGIPCGYIDYGSVNGKFLSIVSVNRILGKSMLKNKSTQTARMIMSSYIGYLRNERIIPYDIVECDSNQNHAGESRQQQRDRCMHPTL